MTLLDRLRDVGCNRQPFTPEHADCICRLTNEAAKYISDLEGEFLMYADEVAALGQLSPAKIDGLKRIADRIRRDRNKA
jgi:hypothetical protein